MLKVSLEMASRGRWVMLWLPLAVVSGGEISAALTLSSLGVAVVAVAIAVTRSALGEAPVTRQAVRTLPPPSPRNACALARQLVAEVAH